MAKVIDGKLISKELKDELKEKVKAYKEQGIEITLAVIQVGNDPASSVYVGNKKKAVNTSESTHFLTNLRKIPQRNSYWSLLIHLIRIIR